MENENKDKSQTRVEIIESGPLKITGNFIIKDLKRGTETVVNEVLLCRCGKSGNKPFCDESHKKK